MINNFNELNLSEELIKSIDLLGYKEPTQVQAELIPLLLEKTDAVVKSQTGSGKTAAFVIPLCENINWDDNAAQALILTPTRELAIQINEDVFNIGRFKRIKSSVLFGRDSFNNQAKELKQKTHIVVGTPGRILDHLGRDTFDTSNIQYLIIDEADEMLAMGFIDQVAEIIDYLPRNRVTALLSATLDARIIQLSKRYMNNPVEIEIAPKMTAIDNVEQVFYNTREDEKHLLLQDIAVVENPDSCIIFCNTQAAVDELYQSLLNQKYSCKKIHGGMEQRDRTAIMEKYRLGEFRYLIATDVAARGIDVDNISLVINYDTPRKPETYIHRIGRTGRIGNKGKAITLVAERGQRSFIEIEEYQGKTFSFAKEPTGEEVSRKRSAFYEKMTFVPKAKESKGAQLSRDITKLHINAGKKTKMRAVDIVGTLCSLTDMTADDIGIINIMDISTYVEVLNGKGKAVFKELQTKPIKGRVRRVSYVD